MYVIKRNGKTEVVHFDKVGSIFEFEKYSDRNAVYLWDYGHLMCRGLQITSRINKLCYGLDPLHVDAAFISQKVVQGVYPGVTTVELDELAAQTAASCATKHPDFSTLAARISVSNLHKQTSKVFSDVIEVLHSHIHPKTGQPAPLVSDELYQVVMEVSIEYISTYLQFRILTSFIAVDRTKRDSTLLSSMTEITTSTTSGSRPWRELTCSALRRLSLKDLSTCT
jgi:hypothetical protein